MNHERTVSACIRWVVTAVLLAAIACVDERSGPVSERPPADEVQRVAATPPPSAADSNPTPSPAAPPLQARALPTPVSSSAENADASTEQPPTPTLVVPNAPSAPPATGATAVVSEWRMMGYDEQSSYFNRAETKLDKNNATQLTVAWQADLGGNIYGAPLLVGDHLYATGPDQVRAFVAATGDELWRLELSSTGSLAHVDGTLYLNTHSSNGTRLSAIRASDGELLWQKPHDPQVTDASSSPIPVGDRILIGGSNGNLELSEQSFRGYLSALDRVSGDILWTTYTVPMGAYGASIWSSASADPVAGRAFATTGNNHGPPATETSDAFLAFDLATGEILWTNQRVQNDTFPTPGQLQGPDFDFGANPVLYETAVGGASTALVAAGSKAGEVHAARRDDGQVVWTRKLCDGGADGSRGIYLNSTWSGKYLLVGCNAEPIATLFALDGATGDIAWQRETGMIWGRISVANGVGFTGAGTNLEVFDVDTGALLDSFASDGGTVASTITIANGLVAWGEGMSWSSARPGSMLTVLRVP